MPTALAMLENEHLSFTWHADASADLVDKKTAARWHMGPVALQEDGPINIGHVWLRTERAICEQYPGRFRGVLLAPAAPTEARVRFTLLGLERREMGTFTCTTRLEGPWLEFSLSDIDETLASLIFPPPIESEALVLPYGVGKLLRKPMATRRFWTFYSHLNMRWFGGLCGEAGWLAVFEQGHADAGVLATNLHASPGWLKSLGRWSKPRQVRYRCCSGGYVGLAKAYRAWAQEHGLFRSLKEKMDATPAVRNLLGGRLISIMQCKPVHYENFEDRLLPIPPGTPPQDTPIQVAYTHADVAELLAEFRRLGLERALVNIRGWVNGGYDERHPDIWPPEPALGPMKALRDLCRLGDPLTVALHDQYQDIYRQSPSWPSGVIRTAAGELMRGGFWAGGQSYIVNARDVFAYARRNWEQIRTLQARALFLDTVTAVQLFESYERGHELTRAQDESYDTQLLAFFKNQGLVLGSEEAADFGIPYVDWLENRHRWVAGESVPLWPLVFHDAVFNTRYGSAPPINPETSPPAPRWLPDLLWGYLPLDSFGPFGPSSDRAVVLRTFQETRHVDAWHARIGADEMIAHRYLTDDGQVEETQFSSGAAIIANFAAQPRQVEGVSVPAGGYVLRD